MSEHVKEKTLDGLVQNLEDEITELDKLSGVLTAIRDFYDSDPESATPKQVVILNEVAIDLLAKTSAKLLTVWHELLSCVQKGDPSFEPAYNELLDYIRRNKAQGELTVS